MELSKNNRRGAGRSAGRKLTKPELTEVGRQLRVAAMGGDTSAALALSNFALAEALKAHQAQLVDSLSAAA